MYVIPTLTQCKQITYVKIKARHTSIEFFTTIYNQKNHRKSIIFNTIRQTKTKKNNKISNDIQVQIILAIQFENFNLHKKPWSLAKYKKKLYKYVIKLKYTNLLAY